MDGNTEKFLEDILKPGILNGVAVEIRLERAIHRLRPLCDVQINKDSDDALILTITEEGTVMKFKLLISKSFLKDDKDMYIRNILPLAA